MKLVVAVKLQGNSAQLSALVKTLEVMNIAADHVSAYAFETKIYSKLRLQKACYGDVRRDFGLAAQATVRVIGKVADAYKKDKLTRRKFRPTGAMPFDDRCLSWQISEAGNRGTVSIWTTSGRLKNVRFVGSAAQVEMLRKQRQGESDLVYRDGTFYLYATCDVPEVELGQVTEFLGVDLGIVNIATTSDAVFHSGKKLNRTRARYRHLNGRLQRRGTKSARRLLRKRRRRESRFANDINHVISKKIVAEARRTGRGIALEDLSGIRDRVRLRKPQRATLHSWSFMDLAAKTEYKARRVGVPLVYVDPRNTSKQCSGCGHIHKGNRPTQESFLCRRCDFAEHADLNAARNISMRAVEHWAGVNQPHADNQAAKAA